MGKRTHTAVSEGQRLLAELRLSQRQIAEACGVSHATIQRWLSGAKAPLPDHRLKLQELFGIHRSTWEQAPHAQTLAASLSERLQAHHDAVVAVEAAVAEKPLPDAVEGLEELIRQCREARRVPDVAPTILARIGAIEVRAVAEREKLRDAIELAARSEEARAYFDALVDELTNHPLAEILVVRRFGAVTDADRARFETAYLAWRERHRDLVEAAEAANAAVRAVLPRGARFEAA